MRVVRRAFGGRGVPHVLFTGHGAAKLHCQTFVKFYIK